MAGFLRENCLNIYGGFCLHSFKEMKKCNGYTNNADRPGGIGLTVVIPAYWPIGRLPHVLW